MSKKKNLEIGNAIVIDSTTGGGTALKGEKSEKKKIAKRGIIMATENNIINSDIDSSESVHKYINPDRIDDFHDEQTKKDDSSMITEEDQEITSIRLATEDEAADLELGVVAQSDDKITDLNTSSEFIYTGEYLLDLGIKEIPYLVEPLIPQTGVIAIAGSSDTGKSSFLRQLGCTIATGKSEFLGYPITARYRRVLYVSTEDDISAMAALLQKQNVEKQAHSAFKNIGFIFDTENLEKKLDSALTVNPADAVIIDTFTDLYGGELNSTNKVRFFINGYSAISKKHNCLLIFLHHTGKRTEDLSPSKNNLLGSQGFEAKMRLVIELRKDRSILEHRHLCIVKGNYLPSEYKESSFVLYFDENMLFSNTGVRTPFEQLTSGAPENLSVRPEYVEAIRLSREGKSCRIIENLLKEQGYSVGKSTIAKWTRTLTQAESYSKDCSTGENLIQNEESACPTVQHPLGEVDSGQIDESTGEIIDNDL